MIGENDIIPVQIRPWEMAFPKIVAAKWTQPGHSNIRSASERVETLSGDALTGQVAQYAVTKHLFGLGGVERYSLQNWRNCSDNGHDIDALNLDVKGSLRRDPSKPLISYRLAVRPRERRPGWCFMLVIVDLSNDQNSALAHIVGWASDSMLPDSVETEGPFTGAHILPATQLLPVMPFCWTYFEGSAA